MIATDIETIFNSGVGLSYHTVLRGGAEEPFYQAPTATTPQATIWYRSDYVRSALHELAHWCVAGTARRTRDDYGYWYTPDGRSREQQRLFFQVEVRPQALERLFCEALEISFEVSVDNLNGVSTDREVAAFAGEVECLARELSLHGLGSRARHLLDSMRAFQSLTCHTVASVC
jgi:elongation factor P hydroxylase